MTTLLARNDPVKAQQYFQDKVTFTTGPIEVSRAIRQDQDIVIVDVRAAEDFAAAHIGGAVNLPHGTWNHPVGLSKDKLNVLYCYTHVCHLAAAACVELARQGYPVMEMEGGFLSWTKNNLPVER